MKTIARMPSMSIGSARRRETFRLALFGEQALGEVEPLLHLREAMPELVHFREQALGVGAGRSQRDTLLRRLECQPLLVGFRPSPDPLREGFAHRPPQHERGPDDEHDGDRRDRGYPPVLHTTVPPSRTYQPNRGPPGPSAAIAR